MPQQGSQNMQHREEQNISFKQKDVSVDLIRTKPVQELALKDLTQFPNLSLTLLPGSTVNYVLVRTKEVESRKIGEVGILTRVLNASF